MDEIPVQEPEQPIQSDNKSESLDSAEAFYKRGMEYFNKIAMDLAIIEFDRAIQLNPDFAEVYKQRGLAYICMSWNPEKEQGSKNYNDLAISDFTKYIRLNPGDVEGYILRAGLYGRGDFESALRDYNQAIRLEPNNAKVYKEHGSAYWMNGDIDHAMRDYTQALQINPEDAMTYNNRGLVYSQKGDLDRAIDDFSRAIQLRNLSCDFLNRGLAYSDRGQQPKQSTISEKFWNCAVLILSRTNRQRTN